VGREKSLGRVKPMRVAVFRRLYRSTEDGTLVRSKALKWGESSEVLLREDRAEEDESRPRDS
jgi:hypothetical protein